MDVLFDHEYIENDDYYSDEEIDYFEISDTEDEYDANTINPYIPQCPRPSIQWTLIKLGKNIFEISTIGTIKPYRSLDKSTEGKVLKGTPYRYYSIEDVNYYMHELVWQAFNGMPSEDYEIIHKPEYTEKYRKIYSNKLHNLTIVEKIKMTPLKLDRSLLENKDV
jgi:hypothetical protein